MEQDFAELERLVRQRENEHLEIKEAKVRFGYEEFCKYCVALANSGGGLLVLGMTDKLPRQIVGTTAFPDYESVKSNLFRDIGMLVEITEYLHPDGRVLVTKCPAHPPGEPFQYKGAFLTRIGESLAPMPIDTVRKKLWEIKADFSAELCSGVAIDALEPSAVSAFRHAWARKANNTEILQVSTEQLLHDAELMQGDRLTFAALILFGSDVMLKRKLPQAETVYDPQPHSW